MKKVIYTEKAPKPIGPYNQAIMFDNTLYISGQIPVDPNTGQLDNADIVAQTNRVMNNLKEVLAAAGMTFSNVVKCSIFVSDLSQFATINQVYGQYFGDDAPARETVQVAALPLNVDIEISAIAIK